MNLKIINKLFICLFLLFLFSCESLDLLSDEKKIYEKETEITETKTKITLDDNVINTAKCPLSKFTPPSRRDRFSAPLQCVLGVRI